MRCLLFSKEQCQWQPQECAVHPQALEASPEDLLDDAEAPLPVRAAKVEN